MNKTNIEWVKNPDGTQGFTLNSKSGCLNHDNGLCKGGGFSCYAYKLANGRLRSRYLANENVTPRSYGVPMVEDIFTVNDPFYPRWWAERIKEPYHRKKPAGIFLDDMSDWMLDCWPVEWTKTELQMMHDNPQHRIYTLTKQYQNLIKWSPFPNNCWVGVTACTNGMFTMALQYLSQIEAKVKYISFEPLMGQIGMADHMSMKGIVDLVIIGALSFRGWVSGSYPQLTPMPYGNKDTLQPKVEWVQEIIRVADKSGIPIFIKDNLKPLLKPCYEGLVMLGAIKDGTVANFIYHYDELHKEDFRLRQEMPQED